MLLIIDVGNTNTKFAFFKKNGDLIKIYISATNTIANTKVLPKNIKVDNAYVGTVAPSKNNVITNIIYKTYKIKPVFIKQTDFKTQFNLNRFDINEIGMDILAMCQFIKTKHKSGVGFSFGTATFAVCVNNCDIHGVMIAPSIETGIKRLHMVTELIKFQIVSKLDVNFGFDTKTALASGAFHMISGFINNVLTFAKKKYHINNAYITGGKLKEIKLSHDKNIHHIDEAIIWGYFYLVKSKFTY